MIDATGSPFQSSTHEGVMCLIVDSSVQPDVPECLHQQIGTPSRHCISLFDRTVYAPLQDTGPYLLVCQGPGALADYASELFERRPVGCIGFLPSEAQVQQATEHCRRLLTVRTDEHATRLMRFYEPRWLEPLIASLSDTERDGFLGLFTALSWRNECGWRQYTRQTVPVGDSDSEAPWLHLDAQRLVRITEHRLALLAQVLAERYRDFFDSPDPASSIVTDLQAAQRAGFSGPMALERWLRLSLTHGPTFWDQPATAALLACDALTADEKLDALERR